MVGNVDEVLCFSGVDHVHIRNGQGVEYAEEFHFVRSGSISVVWDSGFTVVQ